MTRLATAEELSDVREAVLAEGLPLEMVDAQEGGKYGFYMVLQFSAVGLDFIKQIEVAKSLLLEFGQLEDMSLYSHEIKK